jgi:hypothetical protein
VPCPAEPRDAEGAVGNLLTVELEALSWYAAQDEVSLRLQRSGLLAVNLDVETVTAERLPGAVEREVRKPATADGIQVKVRPLGGDAPDVAERG